MTNLSLFNDGLQSDIATRASQKRTFWQTLTRICRIASADLWGAAKGAVLGGTVIGGIGGFNPIAISVGVGVGSVVCAVGGSSEAARRDNVKYNDTQLMGYNFPRITSDPLYVYQNMTNISEKQIQNAIAETNLDVQILNENPELQRIGILHNLTLKNLQNPKPKTRVVDSDPNDPGYKIVTHQDFRVGYSENITFSSYLIDQYDYLFTDNGINPNYNYNRMSPTAVEILRLFNNLYRFYPDKLEDIDFIVNYYTNQIAASTGLDTTEKDAMLAAMSVAAYSPRFWIEELNLNE